MSRVFLALVLVSAVFSSALLPSALCESIVFDSCSNTVTLPTTGGNATNVIAVTDAAISTSPYWFVVYLNNGHGYRPISANEKESFFLDTREWSEAEFMGATYYPPGCDPAWNSSCVTAPCPLGDCMRNHSMPNTEEGAYVFHFKIPQYGTFTGNLTYINVGSSPLTVQEQISISIYNPMPEATVDPVTIVGDPQFVGLRGQSYQVHGIDGAVYNLVSEHNVQVNSRFVFLTEGKCPVLASGKKDSNCWSHPGSYLGEMSFQQLVDGELHAALVLSGPADTGFDLVEVDGQALAVGDKVTFGSFSVRFVSSHLLHVHTERFDFELSNSDRFLNQQLRAKVPLEQLHSHGLIGQTHSADTYRTSIKYIQGEVDDYELQDKGDDIMGRQFIYNRFQL